MMALRRAVLRVPRAGPFPVVSRALSTANTPASSESANPTTAAAAAPKPKPNPKPKPAKAPVAPDVTRELASLCKNRGFIFAVRRVCARCFEQRLTCVLDVMCDVMM
jgi:hypothetical protein